MRFESDNCGVHFGVIDSNCSADRPIPAALAKLKALGATQLSFVMLTHPHADHYRGMSQILNAYKGKIDAFLCFPASEFIRGNRKKLRPIFEKVAQTDGSLASDLTELLQILVFADRESKSSKMRWEDAPGPRNAIYLKGLEGAECEVLQPLPRVKGKFFELLKAESIEALTGEHPNSMSVALRITIAGTSILLGGDSTYDDWYKHRHQTRDHGFAPNARVLKTPHHGSRDDVKADMFSYWFLSEEAKQPRFALISADGRRHPYPEVLQAFRDANIQPYCTNLARVCGGSKLNALFTAPGISKDVSRFINAGDIEVSAGALQECQGEIHVRVDKHGFLTVTPQHAHPCGFRKDYPLLGLAGAT